MTTNTATAQTTSRNHNLIQGILGSLSSLFQYPGAPRHGERYGAWLKLQVVVDRLSAGCVDVYTREQIRACHEQAERENDRRLRDAGMLAGPRYDANFMAALTLSRNLLRQAGL